MTDNRKVLESTNEAPSLDRTMPAPEQPAEQGRNLGGITQTADSAMRGDKPGTQPAPAGKSSGDRSDPAGSSSPPAPAKKATEDATSEDARNPEDESALESLGRAIGAPLDGEAAEKEPRR